MATSKGWRTAIAEAADEGIIVRGYDLNELIGRLSFSEMLYLVNRGELATTEQGRMIDALLVAASDHGISPSSTVTRFLSASGVPIQVAVAGGLMTFGDIHGGAGQTCALLLQTGVTEAGGDDAKLTALAEQVVQDYRSRHHVLEGFGHPQHPSGDPRTHRLMAIAASLRVAGPHVAYLHRLQTALCTALGRQVAINIDGIMAALISDLGFDYRMARAFMIIGRSMGLSAHAIEEIDREGGWRQIPLSEITYDGAGPRSLPDESASNR